LTKAKIKMQLKCSVSRLADFRSIYVNDIEKKT